MHTWSACADELDASDAGGTEATPPLGLAGRAGVLVVGLWIDVGFVTGFGAGLLFATAAAMLIDRMTGHRV